MRHQLLRLIRDALEWDDIFTPDTAPEDAFFEDHVTFLYDALLDLMGPGRDPAFLAMYLLANRSFPASLANVEFAGVQHHGENPITQDIVEFEHEWWSNAENGPPPGEREVLLPPLLWDDGKKWAHDWKVFSLTLWVEPSFREDLMGELATPFPPPSGKSGYTFTERWTEPLVRRYAPSGQMIR